MTFETARDAGEPISDEAREIAARAHLYAGLVWLVCCTSFFLPIAAVFYVGSQYKERPKHPFALYHLNQAFVFQAMVLFLVIGLMVLGYVVTTVATLAGIDLLASGIVYGIEIIPWILGAVLPLLSVGKAKAGRWEGYPVVAERVLRMRSPIFK